MELIVKPEVLTSYIYGPRFGNAETVSFYVLHNVSTLNQNCHIQELVIMHVIKARELPPDGTFIHH